MDNKKIINYRIVEKFIDPTNREKDIKLFETEIVGLLDHGWEPLGGVSISLGPWFDLPTGGSFA